MMLNESIFEEYNEWTYVSSKDVRDTDGFITDYTWYKRINNAGDEEHIFIFGDSDIYGPYDSTPDYETDSEERAQEWFDNYRGFDDDELDEGLNYRDFDSFKKIADEIGLKTAADIERFRKEYVEEGESDLEAIKRYRAELGDDFELKEGFFDRFKKKQKEPKSQKWGIFDTTSYRCVWDFDTEDEARDYFRNMSQSSQYKYTVRPITESLTDSSLEKLCSDHNLICDELTEDDLESFGIDELMNMYEGDVTYYCIDTGEGQQVVVALSDEGRITIEEDTDELGFGIGDEYKNAQVFIKSYLKYTGRNPLTEDTKYFYKKRRETLFDVINDELTEGELGYVFNGKAYTQTKLPSANYDVYDCGILYPEKGEPHYIDDETCHITVRAASVEQLQPAVDIAKKYDREYEFTTDKYARTAKKERITIFMKKGDCTEPYSNKNQPVATQAKSSKDNDELEELEEALPAIVGAAITAAASGAGARLVDKIFGESVATGQRGRYQVEVFDEGNWHKLNCWSTIAKAIKAGEAAVEAVYQDYRVIDKESGSEVELYEGFLDKFKKKKKAVKYGLYNRYGRMIYGPFDSQVEAQIEYEAQTKYSDKYANELTVRPLDEVDYKRYVTEGFQSKATSAEIAHEIAIKARRAFNLSAYEVETLEHDINNLRADEWVDQFEQLSPKSKLRKLFFDNAVAEETEELNERYLSGRYVWCEYKDVKGMNIYQLCRYVEELYKDKFRREVKVTDAIDQSYDYHNKELPFIVEADFGDEESVKGCDGFWFIVNCTEDEAKKLQGADLNESASDLKTKKTVLNQLLDDLRLLLTCETLVDVEKLNDKFNVFDALNTVKNNIENGMSEEDSVIDAQSYLMQRTATLQREVTSAKNASIKPVNESVEGESKYVYFFPYVGARQLPKAQALKMARDKLKLMEEGSGAGEVGQGFAIYCVESNDGEESWTARNDEREFLHSLNGLSEGLIEEFGDEAEIYRGVELIPVCTSKIIYGSEEMEPVHPVVYLFRYNGSMFDDSLVKKLSRYTNSNNYTLDGSKLIVDKFFELYTESEQLVEGAMKELAIEIQNEGGKDKWLSAMSKRIAEMREMLSYLKNEAPREVNRGGNFDSYEELAEAVADIEKELDELLVKVQAVA